MKALIFALGLLAAVPAMAQTASVTACDYQGAFARPGDRYVSTRLIAPRNGRCSHAVGGTAGNVQVITPPRNGRLEASAGGLTYIPNPGFVGTDQYVFSGRQPGGTVQATVNVEVR